jgi:putative peptidoglycan lipid II flippase
MEPGMVGADEPLARQSLSVAQWTLVSRVTGFMRAAAIGAVLGPTYLGNAFQATNMVPNLVFELLTGSLLVSLLVPVLVRLVDARDAAAAQRTAGGFLGLAVVGFLGVVAVGLAAAPLLAAALTSAVPDPQVARAQQHAALLLLALFAPQILFYALAGIGAAVMNAHGRFALAAAAPLIENVGVIAALAAFALLAGVGQPLTAVNDAELLVLGLGTTAAVGLHACAQWWGARRVGVPIRPRLGWREPEVRALVGQAAPSLGYAALNAFRYLAVTIVANRVAGGVVAFFLALNFFFLPVALGARPVATTLLPVLSRLRYERSWQRVRDEFVNGIGLVVFVTVPAASAYLVLAFPLARAASFGELATPDAITLVAASLAGLALGVVGEGVFLLATSAAYALEDARASFRGMLLRTMVFMAGLPVAMSMSSGWTVLLALGAAMSLGDLTAALYLSRRILAQLPGGRSLALPLLRACTASAAMVVPAYAVAVALEGAVGGKVGSLLGVFGGGLVGAVLFIAIHYAMRSPEMAFFRTALSRRPTPRDPGRQG